MSQYHRLLSTGATYFFTLVTYHRRPVLTDEPVRAALRRSFHLVRRRCPFTVDAFVLLPDHLHCIWTLPDGDADYTSRWICVKRLTSQQLREMLSPPESASAGMRRELGLWQRRFWEHRIRDERDFERHADYIHWNPVRHGHVRAVIEWPYSSFHRYVESGIYPPNWGGRGPSGEVGDFGEPD